MVRRGRLTVPFVLLLLLLAAPAAAKRRRKKKSQPVNDPVALGHHQRGVMAHVQGDPEGAVSAFRRAIDAQPDFAYAYYRLGFVLQEQEQLAREGTKPRGTAAADEDPVSLFRCGSPADRPKL